MGWEFVSFRMLYLTTYKTLARTLGDITGVSQLILVNGFSGIDYALLKSCHGLSIASGE